MDPFNGLFSLERVSRRRKLSLFVPSHGMSYLGGNSFPTMRCSHRSFTSAPPSKEFFGIMRLYPLAMAEVGAPRRTGDCNHKPISLGSHANQCLVFTDRTERPCANSGSILHSHCRKGEITLFVDCITEESSNDGVA